MSGKILVIGATGTVGAPLVAELVARGELVKAATRSGAANVPAGAEAVRFDLTNPGTFDAALAGADRIYALTPAGTVDVFGILKPIVEAATSRGAKVVLQTAMGVEADDNIPFRRLELFLERSGAPFVILRPNAFTDNFVTYWGHQVRAGEIRFPAGDGKSAFIDARDIAAAAAGALTNDAHNGKAFTLTGPSAHSYPEVAELLSAVLGHPVIYSAVDPGTFVAEMTAAGMASDYAELMAGVFLPVAAGWAAGVTGDVEALSGKAPRNLKTSIADLAPKLAALAS